MVPRDLLPHVDKIELYIGHVSKVMCTFSHLWHGVTHARTHARTPASKLRGWSSWVKCDSWKFFDGTVSRWSQLSPLAQPLFRLTKADTYVVFLYVYPREIDYIFIPSSSSATAIFDNNTSMWWRSLQSPLRRAVTMNQWLLSFAALTLNLHFHDLDSLHHYLF